MEIPEGERKELAAKAARLEGKQLFVKAAEIYLKLGDSAGAAAAYEKGSDFGKAAALFEKMGKSEDAERCRKKRDEASSGATWQDVQAEFQQDRGNPY